MTAFLRGILLTLLLATLSTPARADYNKALISLEYTHAPAGSDDGLRTPASRAPGAPTPESRAPAQPMPESPASRLPATPTPEFPAREPPTPAEVSDAGKATFGSQETRPKEAEMPSADDDSRSERER